MRRFELFLVYGEIFAIGWPAIFGVRTRRGIVAGILLVLFVLQWRIEGLRWQMLPIYAAALGLGIGDIVAVDRDLDWTRRLARGVFGSAALAVAVILPVVLPVPTLPVPSGTVGIGTYTLELVERANPEVYGDEPGSPRRLNVQVWYPATLEEGSERAVWTEDWEEVVPAMARQLGFPSWFFNHTRYTESHAVVDAELAPGSYPVVVYSHGWNGFRTVAVNQIESLVSNGYIVVAPDHTYSSITTVFPDGEVVAADPAALPDEEEVGPDAFQTAAVQLLDVYRADLVAILDALNRGENGPFAGLADAPDLTRVGIYGVDVGGGAAIRLCIEDERCDAVLGFDPWVEPYPDEVIAETAVRPAMYLRSDEARDTENDAVLRGIAGRSAATTYWIGIEGAEKSDFTVTPLFSPIAHRLGLKGPIPAGRVIPIVDGYLVGFFDVYLLGTGSAAIDTSTRDEVSVEVINPA